MTSSHPIDVEKLLADQLAQASPDLLRGLLSALIHALMGAEADAICGAGYRERSDERSNSRNLTAEDQFAFRPAGGKPGTFMFFYPAAEDSSYSRHRVGLQHLAFMVKTRSAVREVHQLVQRLGGEVLHEPQPFPQYAPPYFATFWLDPFGLMLEAVCHYDRD